MDGRLNFTMDRGRYLPTTPATAALSSMGQAAFEAATASAALRHPLVDMSRTGTPSSVTSLGQYGGRYYPSSTLPFQTPGASFMMDSYLGARPPTGQEGLKPSLHQLQHYWAAHSEGLSRYNQLASGMYSPYLPLMPGTDPVSAVYPHAAAMAQTQTPYHRIYDLGTEAQYAGACATFTGDPSMSALFRGPASTGLHSPISESPLLTCMSGSTTSKLMTTDTKPDVSSLEKLSKTVESAGSGSNSFRQTIDSKHSVKSEPGISKSCDSAKNSSKSEVKRERKAVGAGESKKDRKDRKESNLSKDSIHSVHIHGKAKKENKNSASQSQTDSSCTKKDTKCARVDVKKQSSNSSETRTSCDKVTKSGMNLNSKESGEAKPKIVPDSSEKISNNNTFTTTSSPGPSPAKVSSTSDGAPRVSSPVLESTPCLARTESIPTLTTVTVTSSESPVMVTSTHCGSPGVYGTQPSTRITTCVTPSTPKTASPNLTVESKKTDSTSSEYLGTDSGPYHTVYSYTQQNNPVRDGKKVHATTVTPEVGTLPSPTVPTCSTTVIQTKPSAEEVKVEGSRSCCAEKTSTLSQSTVVSSGNVDVSTTSTSAKKKSSENKHKSASEKLKRMGNESDKPLSQMMLNNNLTANSSEGVSVTANQHMFYPQGHPGVTVDCRPCDIYGQPIPFSTTSLQFSTNSCHMGYDPGMRPIDLSSPKENRKKGKTATGSDHSKNLPEASDRCRSESNSSSKCDSASSVPYRDIIHEYGQPRSNVTLLETHLPTLSEDKGNVAPVGAVQASKAPVQPVPSQQRMWYDYSMQGQQMIVGGVPTPYMYPYDQMQPYYATMTVAGQGEHPQEAQQEAMCLTSPGSNSVTSASSNVASGANTARDMDGNSNGSSEKFSGSMKSEDTRELKIRSPSLSSPHPLTQSNPMSNSSTPSHSRQSSPTPVQQSGQVHAKSGIDSFASSCSVELGSNLTNSQHQQSGATHQTTRKTTKHRPLSNNNKTVGHGLKSVKDHGTEDSMSISGSGIPVGIAVARQRQDHNKETVKEDISHEVHVPVTTAEGCTFQQEHTDREEFLREQKELLENRSHVATATTGTVAIGDGRTELSANLVVTGGNVITTSNGWRDPTGGDPTRQFSNQWIQTGHPINPGLWVGQAAFGMPPTLPATPTLDTSHLPFTSPGGFKLAQDPVTGQLFLIPAANLGNLAFAAPPFQAGVSTCTAQTVLATQPFPQMAIPSQSLPPATPSMEQNAPEQHLISSPQDIPENETFEEETEANSDECRSATSGTPHEGWPGGSGGENAATPDEEASTLRETNQSCVEVEKATDHTVAIAPQTAYIAGYPAMGAGQTYATYSYPHPQISYLYHDPSLLSLHNMPVTALPESPAVAALKSECTPAVRSQGTSPITMTTSSSPTIPTRTMGAEPCGVPEVKVESVDVKTIPPQVTTCSVQTGNSPIPCSSPKVEENEVDEKQQSIVQAAVVQPIVQSVVQPVVQVVEPAKEADTPTCVSDSVSAAEALQTLKHTKAKKEKKKKDSSRNSDKKSEKKINFVEKKSHSIEKKKSKLLKLKKSSMKKSKSSSNSTKDSERTDVKTAKDSVKYNPYTDPQILQAADGLELLSALAEKRAKCASVDEPISPPPCVSKADVIDEYEFTDNPVIDINRNYSPLKSGKRTCYANSERDYSAIKKQSSGPAMFASTGLNWPTGPETMDAMELEMRLRLAELQRRYKQKQRELAKLHPKKDKEEEETFPTKRGPGRPRKRKFLSRKSDSHNTSASDSSRSSGHKEPVAKKKKLVEKLVDRVFRKTGRDKNRKLKGSKSLTNEGVSAVKSKADSKKHGSTSISQDGGSPVKKAKGRSISQSPVHSEKTKGAMSGHLKCTGDKKKKSISSKTGKLFDLGSGGEKKVKSKKSSKKSTTSFVGSKLFKSTKEGLSDSSDGECGLGLLAKYASGSVTEMNLSKKKMRSSVEEGWLPAAPSGSVVLSMSTKAEDSKQGPIVKRESDTDHSDPTSVSKRRKPGRPKKYCNPGKSAGNTETIVAKKPKNLGLIKFNKNKDRKIDMKAQERKMKLENSSVLKPLYLDEEWCLRRSERIFLSEPSPQPSPNDGAALLGSKVTVGTGRDELKSPRPRAKSLDKPRAKVNRSKSLQDLSQKVKRKYSKTFGMKNSSSGSAHKRMDAYGKIPGKFGQYYVDSDTDSDQSSDADDLPLSTLRDRSIPPEPRTCVVNKDDLEDDTRVLLFMDGLFHEGAVKGIRPPDVYGVVIDGERGNRPHIYSQEEILKEAILDVEPGSTRYLPEGTRVCAYWSQQFSCLYPGTVSKSSPNPNADPNSVNVEFDDGDSGRIPVDHIRMLPADYPHVSYDTNPILIVGKRRRRTASDDFDYCRSSTSELSPIPGMAAIKWAKYRNNPLKQRKLTIEKSSSKGGNLVELDESEELKDNVFMDGQTGERGVILLEKKSQHGRKKHKHKDKTGSSGKDGECGGKHHHKKHKKNYGKDGKIATNPTTMPVFTCPETSFASLAKSDACQSLMSSSNSTATSSFLLQSTSYDEKTFNWVMRNPLVMQAGGDGGADGFESGEGTIETLSTTNPASDDGEDNYSNDDVTDMNDDTDVDDELDNNNGNDQKVHHGSRSKLQTGAIRKKKPEKKKSADYKSNIAAFLPPQQVWKWSGKSTKRPGMKGKAKKEFYKAITRGQEAIMVGDCAVFLSTGRPNLPFVGRIENMWEGWGGNMVVKVKWFYHPEETKGGKKLPEPKGALFQSPHSDENDVQTISHRCEVLPFLEYKRRRLDAIRKGKEYLLDSEELYYLAGSYDPSLSQISYESLVLG